MPFFPLPQDCPALHNCVRHAHLPVSQCCLDWSRCQNIKQDSAPDVLLRPAASFCDGNPSPPALLSIGLGLLTAPPLPCSFMMEYDIHTLLDFLTLLATVWVIYMLRFPLRSSYQDKEDSLKFYFVVS